MVASTLNDGLCASILIGSSSVSALTDNPFILHLPPPLPPASPCLGVGFRVCGLGCWVLGFGFGVQGMGFGVEGLRLRISTLLHHSQQAVLSDRQVLRVITGALYCGQPFQAAFGRRNPKTIDVGACTFDRMVQDISLVHRMTIRSVARISVCVAALEATQGQMDGFFRQLPFRCHLEEVASAGDRLEICPQLDSRVEGHPGGGGHRGGTLNSKP